METGEIIKYLRKKEGYTQDQLAEKLGVNKSSIQKYENGMVQNLKIQTIRDLCNLFQVPPWYFIFPDRTFIEVIDQTEAVRKQIIIFISFYTMLSNDGRKRLWEHIQDFMEIEKYRSKDNETSKEELKLLKEIIEYQEY